MRALLRILEFFNLAQQYLTRPKKIRLLSFGTSCYFEDYFVFHVFDRLQVQEKSVVTESVN